jgi:hypothetical protein
MIQNLNSPIHLAPETADWWRAMLRAFFIETRHSKLLRLACEARDRCQQGRELLDRAREQRLKSP